MFDEDGGGGGGGGGGGSGGSAAAAVEAELAKLAAWPEPSSGAKLHRFMSAAKKYSHWVRDYPRLAAPLSELLHVRWAAKGKADVWGDALTKAFKVGDSGTLIANSLTWMWQHTRRCV